VISGVCQALANGDVDAEEAAVIRIEIAEAQRCLAELDALAALVAGEEVG